MADALPPPQDVLRNVLAPHRPRLPDVLAWLRDALDQSSVGRKIRADGGGVDWRLIDASYQAELAIQALEDLVARGIVPESWASGWPQFLVPCAKCSPSGAPSYPTARCSKCKEIGFVRRQRTGDLKLVLSLASDPQGVSSVEDVGTALRRDLTTWGWQPLRSTAWERMTGRRVEWWRKPAGAEGPLGASLDAWRDTHGAVDRSVYEAFAATHADEVALEHARDQWSLAQALERGDRIEVKNHPHARPRYTGNNGKLFRDMPNPYRALRRIDDLGYTAAEVLGDNLVIQVRDPWTPAGSLQAR